jgi:hypothetical protein
MQYCSRKIHVTIHVYIACGRYIHITMYIHIHIHMRKNKTIYMYMYTYNLYDDDFNSSITLN